MSRIEEIAKEISILMPAIARRILLEFFQLVDISQSQLLTIMAIYEKEPCRLSDLSMQMRISDPTASGLVDRLAKGGYINREQDRDDRRAISIILTVKGKNLAKKFRGMVKERWLDILKEIPKKDSEDFIRILREIRSKI